MSPAQLAPRPRPLIGKRAVGEVVQIGRTRWIIRLLRGEHVELEASNISPRVWWTTTLSSLPNS